MYLDLKVKLSNKFWVLHLANTCLLFAAARRTASSLSLPVSSRMYGHEDDFEMNK
jgi:hypothetical protein